MSQANAQSVSIDAHAHWAPQAYIDYAAQQGGKVSGGPISRLMYDLEARMKWMDERNVKTHVLAYYPETLRFMIDLVGVDRVVIGTDNYAKMDVEQPNELVQSLKLPAADLQRIPYGNAAKLLRL